MTQLITENPLISGILVLLLGTLFGILVEKVRSRFVRLKYHSLVNRIGISADDPIFGSIRVTHYDVQLRNLYSVDIELHNESSRDLEQIVLDVYPNQGTLLLNERTGIKDSPYIVKWSDEFKKEVAATPGTNLTQAQFDFYHGNRQYKLEVIKRYSSLEFSYVCTRPNDDNLPSVYVSSPTKGITIKNVRYHIFSNGLILGVPFVKTLPFGLFLCSFGILGLWTFKVDHLVSMIICLLAGMTVTLVGALGYKIFDKVRRLVTA